MPIRKHLHLSRETIVYAVFWLLLFTAPLLTAYFHTSATGSRTLNTGEARHAWTMFALYMLFFIVHDRIAAPLIVYKRKNKAYACVTVLIIGVYLLLQPILMQRRQSPDGIQQENIMPPGNDRSVSGAPMVPPGRQQRPVPPPDGGQHRPEHMEERPALTPNIIVNTLIMIGLFGVNIGVKLYFKGERDRGKMEQLEREHLYEQLQYLKYQINPHFFMNTLNNIQVLIDIDTEKAKTALRELSVMMRFVLYDADKNMVPLHRETDFLKNYIRLMQLRYTDELSITVDIPDNMPDVPVPPLIFVTFVENAFKHGAENADGSFITVSMDNEDDMTVFLCMNSMLQKHENNKATMPNESGVGLSNVRKRLDIIYGDSYSLDIADSGTVYRVCMRLPKAPVIKDKENKNFENENKMYSR